MSLRGKEIIIGARYSKTFKVHYGSVGKVLVFQLIIEKKIIDQMDKGNESALEFKIFLQES